MMAVAPAVRFSVVVPAYNEQDSVAATLRSLLGQDFRGRYEIIVVDNGSDDETAAIARRAGVRVVSEPVRGVCAARQAGTLAAGGEIIVSTDADTVHPPDWLSRIDLAFRTQPEIVAVAGPCRYADPPWWARIFPPAYFAAVAVVHRLTGRIFYLTATNVAFRSEGFAGYDTALTQGGDEVDLLRRLRRQGRLYWTRDNAVLTSSRRIEQGLAYTVLISYGYHYALSYAINRAAARPVLGTAPAIRPEDERDVRLRRRRGRLMLLATAVAVTGAVVRRERRRRATSS